MHEVVKNEKKESSRARPPLQTRTGPTALLSTNSSMSLSKEEEQQKRIAARAAAAMAQVLHRRREPRSLLMWGDRRKVRANFLFFLHFILYSAKHRNAIIIIIVSNAFINLLCGITLFHNQFVKMLFNIQI
jgi:hypothetical protein